MIRNNEKRAKRETHSAGPGIWGEIVKHVKYEKYTQQDLDFGEKNDERGK